MTPCPCNPKKLFSTCCEPYLNGFKNAETPEILMRSRYSAYALARIDYIQKTMTGKAAKNYDPLSAKAWACSLQWLKLTVLEAPIPTPNSGTVTFFAVFSKNNIKDHIYEKSFFEKKENTWFYTDGITLNINRNDPCPCQSGKKFKACCYQ